MPEFGLKLSNATYFFVSVSGTTSEVLRTAVPRIVYYEFLQRETIISPAAPPVNGLAENDNATIHKSRFLGRMSVRTVVCQHSTTVDLYGPPRTLIKIVIVCLLVNKTIFEPATSYICIRIPCRSIILWSEDITTGVGGKETFKSQRFVEREPITIPKRVSTKKVWYKVITKIEPNLPIKLLLYDTRALIHRCLTWKYTEVKSGKDCVLIQLHLMHDDNIYDRNATAISWTIKWSMCYSRQETKLHITYWCFNTQVQSIVYFVKRNATDMFYFYLRF